MKKNIQILLSLIFLVFLSACTDPQGASAPDPSSEGEVKSTAANKRWPFLSEKDTNELEDNVAKKNYYVMLDNSGSMKNGACNGSGSRMDNAKAALREFAKFVLDDANLGLMTFNGEVVPLGSGSSSRSVFLAEVDNARANTNTPLRWAVREGYARLTQQGKKQLGYGGFYFVIVTDGESTDGDPRKAVNVVLQESPIVIHTIGFCIGSDHSLNQPGRTVYKEANDVESLRSGLKEVLAESASFEPGGFKQ